MLPIRAELVVFPAFLRIAEHLVGLVDLLELLLGRLLVLGHVRVVLARQLAERLLDVLGAGIARHAENRIVVFEFDGHEVREEDGLSMSCCEANEPSMKSSSGNRFPALDKRERKPDSPPA